MPFIIKGFRQVENCRKIERIPRPGKYEETWQRKEEKWGGNLGLHVKENSMEFNWEIAKV